MVFVAVITIVLACPILVFALLFSNSHAFVPVEEKALQSAQEVLINIGDVAPAEIAYYIATYYPDCYGFLRKHLEANRNQYALTVTAVFDPNDPRFPSTNGSWDATVAVHFIDESEVELYLYGGHWEGCKIMQTFASTRAR